MDNIGDYSEWYPDETEEDFWETAKVMEYAKYDMAYIAKYSPRPNTIAEKYLEDTNSHAEKKRREKHLEEILKKTGYPCGGTPSFGYNAEFLIDPKVMEKEIVYTGGGSENSLVKILTKELQKSNNGKIVRVRK